LIYALLTVECTEITDNCLGLSVHFKCIDKISNAIWGLQFQDIGLSWYQLETAFLLIAILYRELLVVYQTEKLDILSDNE